MKKNLIVILIFLFIFAEAQQEISFNIKATYKLLVSSETGKVAENAVLLINGIEKQSLFQSENNYEADSILSNQIKSSLLQAGTFTINEGDFKKSIFNELYYFDGNRFTVFEMAFSNGYKYNDDSDLRWTISDEVKKIGKLQVQKATCIINKKKYTAWFSMDYTFPLGPFKFNGLPGLIVEVSSDSNDLEIQLLSIKTINSTKDMAQYGKFVTVQKKDFRTKIKENLETTNVSAFILEDN